MQFARGHRPGAPTDEAEAGPFPGAQPVRERPIILRTEISAPGTPACPPEDRAARCEEFAFALDQVGRQPVEVSSWTSG